VVADSTEGGLGAAAQAHARWFAQRGWSVALAAPGAGAAVVAPAVAVQTPVPGGAFDVPGMLAAVAALRRLLRECRPSVVHAHGTRSQLLCLLAGRVPYVTMHGAGRVEGQARVGTALRVAARRVAPALARAAYSASPAVGWRTLLHASPRLAELNRLPAPMGTPTFLWLGRLDAPKRPDVFIDALALLARPVRGLVVGDGPLRAEAEARAERLGLEVDFLGHRSDLSDHLSRAFAVCLFSDFEGVPFSVQEAMWSGRAVVLSDLPSLRWFAGGHASFARDAVEAAGAMQQLCVDAVAGREGDDAARHARSLLSEDAPFPQLLADYGHRPVT